MGFRLAALSFLAFLLLFVVRRFSNAADTLSAGDVLKDWQILESRNKFFQFGFFNPAHSSNRYLAIQFLNIAGNKIVWVANRENPLNDTSGYLNITRDGLLVISDERGFSFSVNPEQPATLPNTSLTLLDSGNLVLESGQEVVWQSFDHPTDTILPGMKFGLFDKKSQTQPRNNILTSWLGTGATSAGAFTLGVDPNDPRKLEIRRRGNLYWRYGEWNETDDGYVPISGDQIKIKYISNENESYFLYTLVNATASWADIDPSGKINYFIGDTGINSDFSSFFGVEVACEVGTGYQASDGCVEKKSSKCSRGNEFVVVFGLIEMWGDILNNRSLGISDCEEICRHNCSCSAYAPLSLDGTGCRFSNAPLIVDIPSELKETFHYIHSTSSAYPPVASPTPGAQPAEKGHSEDKNLGAKVGASILVVLGFLALVSLVWYLIRKKRSSKGEIESRRSQVGWETEQYMNELGSSIAAIDERLTHSSMLKGSKDHELPLFSFSTIEAATDHFSVANKLGQGGFGPVFKGKLDDGKEIAVKRLCERSGQGAEEFKNEVVLISKVQHRNLVRIYGCCIKGVEKLLIYEYLPNKSLDTFLFDETKRKLLDWKLRMNIIEGIAQGLLYLHKYSRLKIIHRDLKTSNILLDNNMNPKISDFGTAKIFGENESRANTSRIVGTYGYMSPEYAMDGLYSVKSDVFSFGVMILEIISGKKNTGFYQTNQSPNLVRHAWNLWKEEKTLELMDPILAETCELNELGRLVRIGLLCVQENASDRPTMFDVVSMLRSELGNLPEPNQSSFSTLLAFNSGELPIITNSSSVNEVTMSSTQGRWSCS